MIFLIERERERYKSAFAPFLVTSNWSSVHRYFGAISTRSVGCRVVRDKNNSEHTSLIIVYEWMNDPLLCSKVRRVKSEGYGPYSLHCHLSIILSTFKISRLWFSFPSFQVIIINIIDFIFFIHFNFYTYFKVNFES